MEKRIETENFSVGYDKRVLIHDISFSVKAGQILTLIGPNGAGKSTILKSITRQLKPIDGVVYLDGQEMKKMHQEDIAKHLSMVTTERIAPERMSCKEVVATGRYPYTGRMGILSKEDWKKVDDAIDMVHANEVSNHDFLKISDGQRQRIMLARAICQSAGTLVLDEPTAYLDMKYKLDILMNIRMLAQKQKLAVVMSLHELDLAQKISDTIACVDGEKISCLDTPEKVFSGDRIQRLFGVSTECFDASLGVMYFPVQPKTPCVFVICGDGSGIPVFYQLQKAGIPFAAGILYENDVDYRVAKATASSIVSAASFYPIQEEKLTKARKMIDICERCICTLKTFGPYNKENEVLLAYAKSKGKI